MFVELEKYLEVAVSIYPLSPLESHGMWRKKGERHRATTGEGGRDDNVPAVSVQVVASITLRLVFIRIYTV